MNEAGMDRMMPEKCPQCGATLPAGALAGLCPACLLQQGAATDTATRSNAKPFVPLTVEEVATHFPGLEILELLGRGGMGAVYKARQKQLDRLVALKILPPRSGDDSAFADRFTREAKALARLNHPGIVTLYEFGKVEPQPSGLNPQPSNGLYYFLMEFVDGVNLRQLLAGGRIAPREALAIVPQICDALQYAHDQGIVHRDIKPENILLDRRGRVKVADFGLAKLVEANAPLTSSLSSSERESVAARPGEGKTPALTDAGKIMGTPAYMAPEQAEHPGEVDHRADIYALGVVFYQMLTGELPGKRIEAPSKKVQIDVRLDEVVLRALEKNPERRYQEVSEVKTMVETILNSETAATSPSEQVKAQPSVVLAPARGRDYRTRQTLFGLPLVHVAWGIDPVTGRPRVAKGIVAVGPSAFGVIAVGFSAWGLFPCGLVAGGFWPVGLLLAVGFEAVGLAAAGFHAVGLLALAFWRAVGLVAAGPLPIGVERIVVEKGSVGLLFVLATVAACLMDRLIRALGSAAVPPAEPARKNLTDEIIAIVCGILAALLALLVLAGITRQKVPPGSGNTYLPLLRTTVRVLDVPTSFDQAQLLRPGGLFDSGDVKILAAPFVVVTNGQEGTIEVPDVPDSDAGPLGFAVLGGRAKTLFVQPTLKNGTYWVDYSLAGLVRELGIHSNSVSRQVLRSGSVKLNEYLPMEEHGLNNGRKRLAVLSFELEILRAESATARPAAAQKPSFGLPGAGFVGLVAGGLTALYLALRKRQRAGSLGVAPAEPRSSRTAIVGVGFGILGMFALVLDAVIGDSILLDEGPSWVLEALTALFLLTSTILGWVAASQIRHWEGKLHGMWLAVSDGLLFPLLALNGLIAFRASTMVQTFSAIDGVVAQLGIQSASGERFKWLAGIATVFMCVVLNTLITWGVWRVVNKRSAGAPPVDSENSTFGKWARGPLLVGTIGPSLLMTIVPWYEGLAGGLAAAIGSVALALALVRGLMSWRQRLGKFVIIATSVLFVALIVAAAVLSFVVVPTKQARLQAAFGPVTECTLPMDEDGRTPLFDLDHNQTVFNPKPGDTAGDMWQRLAQLKKPGVAIHYDGQTHVIAVSGMTIRRIDGDGDP
jgi:hypothetical protein